LSLTAVSVAICGIFGSVIGPWLLDKLKIKSPIAKGLAMGSAAHGVGTGRAMQMGQIEGAVAGMAIGLMGIFTAIIIPIIELL
jgi:putative effector of murein hydrolase